jgi:hypothetical protein
VAPGLVAVAGAGLLLAPLPATLSTSPLWRRLAGGAVPGPGPRLSQARALARELPAETWLISAIDGPLLEYHVTRGTSRRYVPLSRGLEFVDKPPFRSVPTAQELRPAIFVRLSHQVSAAGPAVVLDRWSLEFAESWPGYRRELEEFLQGFDLLPGGADAPAAPTFYILALSLPDRGLAAYALRDGQPVRGSAEAVYLYEAGVLRHVPSLQVFDARGLRWEDVRRLPDHFLATIPRGLPLSR